MSQHAEMGDWWENCDKLHVFQDWAEKYDKTLLADAWDTFSVTFNKQLNELKHRPMSYWDLDDARKETFIDWLESSGGWGFSDWLEQFYTQAMEPGWDADAGD